MREAGQLMPGGHPTTELQRPLEQSASVARPLPAVYGTYGVEGAEGESRTHVLDYWRAVRKRLPLVLGIVALATVLAVIYNARRPDQYQAKALVQVNLENDSRYASSKNGAVVITNPVNDPSYFNTQLQNLTRADMLRRVIKKLDLEHNPDFLGTKQTRSTWNSLLQMVGLGKKEVDKDAGAAKPQTVSTSSVAAEDNLVSNDPVELKRLEPLVANLQNSLVIVPVRDQRQAFKETRLIEVTYTHTNPKIASDVINSVVETFAAMNLENKEKSATGTTGFLGKRIAELQQQIRASEEKLQAYTRDKGILSTGDGKGDVESDRLVALNGQLVEAENVRKTAEAELQAAQANDAAKSLVLASGKDGTSALINELRAQMHGLETKKALLLTEMTEQNPEVIEVQNQIDAIKKQIDSTTTFATNVTLKNLNTKYVQAKKREDSLHAAFNQQRGKVVVQNEALIQFRLLKQEIDTSQQQLDSLMQKEKDTSITAAGLTNNIQVVEHALAPDYPIGPARVRSVLVIMALSLALGIGLALFLEYLDNTVRSVDDVEKTLRLPLLAMIPTANELTGRRRLLLSPDGSGKPNSSALVGVDSRSPIAEAYRQIRTSVMLSTAGRSPRSLLITSSVPAEGKTTMAVNIAKSFAQTGARVLVVDADMRRPRQHSIFGVNNREGLSTFLSSEKTEEELLEMVKAHEESGLFVLTSGPVPPNPAELLGSDQMRRMLSIVEKSFTHIIIDSPPIASFTDGVLLSAMVDGVLLVVHGSKTTRDIVKRSRQLLQDVGARVFGVVLNNVTLRADDYYYQSYYNSYYTSTEEEPENAHLASSAK